MHITDTVTVDPHKVDNTAHIRLLTLLHPTVKSLIYSGITIPYSPVITPWVYRKERLFSKRILGHERYFGPRRIHGHKMLSFGQSSSIYLKTEIPQMLAIIHLQDQRYWYPYSINIHAETKHYSYTHMVDLKPVKSTRVGNCNKDMTLAVSTITQY